MTPLTDRQRSALTWLLLGRAAWTPALDWARRVGGVVAEGLVAAPLEVVEVWDRDDEGEPFAEPMVTLTPYGAWCVAAEVVDMRWEPDGWVLPSPRALGLRGEADEAAATRSSGRRVRTPRQRPEKMFKSLEHPGLIADGRPGPLEELIDLEAMGRLFGAAVTVKGDESAEGAASESAGAVAEKDCAPSPGRPADPDAGTAGVEADSGAGAPGGLIGGVGSRTRGPKLVDVATGRAIRILGAEVGVDGRGKGKPAG